MNAITLKAYAKINLHLDVTGRLPNGYHTIRSVMHQVSLYDEITVERLDCPTDANQIRVTCTDPAIPTDGRNIVCKCATAFFDHFHISAYSIAIHIDKRIPHGAGMAGGSTDGAAVLKALPTLFHIDTDTETLCRIGSNVGADIPFCVAGGCCLCEGIGEKLTPMERHFRCPLLVAIGGEPVSTPEAYGKIDRLFGDRIEGGTAEGDALAFMSSREIPASLYNIFEAVVLPGHDEARALKEKMPSLGAKTALMSGSGPSVFGLFLTEAARDEAYHTLRDAGIRTFPCEFI